MFRVVRVRVITMDFKLTEEQEMLRSMARDFLAAKCTKKYVRDMEQDERGYSPDIWKEVAQIGWTGLPFPEEYKGGGGTFLDLAILLEEMGRACFPGPFFSTVVLGGLTILDAGSKEQKQEIIPRISQGNSLLTLALAEASGSYQPEAITLRAIPDRGVFLLMGTKLFVPDANAADYLICVSRNKDKSKPQDGITLFLVKAPVQGLKITPMNTIASDKLCEVALDSVMVSYEDVLGKEGKGWPIVEKALLRATAARCMEMVGGAQQVLDMSNAYAKERVQYGKPIGSFQAIQHYLANMAVDVDGCRYISYKAAWKMSEEPDDCQLEVATAKAWTSEAYRRVSSMGHRIHGGIGFTLDHDMQLYYRRAKAAEVTYGDSDFHREKIAQLIGLKS